MNHDLRTMSFEDSENNNVDENSNDHQYNQYANYHNQFLNHQFRRHSVDTDSQEQRDDLAQEIANRAHFYQRSGMQRLQNTNTDEVDSRVHPRYSGGLHRRNLSEDLSVSYNQLPPLPRNNQRNEGARERLLNSNAGNNAHWIPRLHDRRETPSDEEIKVEAEELFLNFTAEQFAEEDLDPYEYMPTCPSFSNPTWKKAGRDLRVLADEFSRSQERKELRFRAQRVNMSSLTCDNFFHLCSELFHKGEGGITQERIVVLFTFIGDIAIQQVRQRAERFISQLMHWSLRFIFDYICSWVQEAGGWGVVLSRGVNMVYNVTLFTLAALSIVALGVFIKKNWNEL